MKKDQGSREDCEAAMKMSSRKAARRKHPERVSCPPGEASLTTTKDSVESLLRRARMATLSGDVGTAIPLYARAIAQGCTQPDAYNDLGALLGARGQIPAAVVQLEMALALDHRAVVVRKNLCQALAAMGFAASEAGRWSDAAAAFGRLTVLDPDSVSSHTNAGAALRRLRSPGPALPYMQRAVELRPQGAAERFNLGSVLLELNRAECEQELDRTLVLDPAHVGARVHLAVVYNRLGQLSRAAALLREAIDHAPDHADAHGNLAGILREQGQMAASLEHYRRSLGLAPDSHRVHSNYLLARQADPAAEPAELLAEHVTWDARFAAPLDPGPAAPGVPRRYSPSVDRNPDRRLRIGYVSPDLRSHAVASFIEPIIAAHDRTQVHVTCYSDAVPDPVTLRIQNAARPEVWREVRGLTDEALASRIVEDEIDVLVDLSGHTADNRLLTFARRPAPVQVTYCGYPGTTGLAAMGWRLTDEIAAPPGPADLQHTEQLWRLPHGFLCFQPNPEYPAPGPLPSLERGFVTFGCFNNLSKLGDQVLRLWARILLSVPSSHLLLKARALSDQEPRERLRRTFLELGIEPERIELVAYAATPVEHAACHARIDVALDPFPYAGATTTCDALWMGVPVVTLAGERHAGRVGASLLGRIGCPELVAASTDSYVEIAARLAVDPARLAGYRASLRSRMTDSPLTNPSVIARDIEAGYRAMWRLFCAQGASEGPLRDPHGVA